MASERFGIFMDQACRTDSITEGQQLAALAQADALDRIAVAVEEGVELLRELVLVAVKEAATAEEARKPVTAELHLAKKFARAEEVPNASQDT